MRCSSFWVKLPIARPKIVWAGLVFLFAADLSACRKTRDAGKAVSDSPMGPSHVGTVEAKRAPRFPGRSESAAEAMPIETQKEQRLPDRVINPPRNLAELEREYLNANTSQPGKAEIISELARLNSPEAWPVLQRIFDREKRLELRMKVVEVTADLDGDTMKEPRWMLFTRAVSATQPLLLRLSAMESLADFEDARTPAVLASLSHDHHATIRESARRLLGERQLLRR